MAGQAGPTLAQGCAIRVSRLTADGSVAIGESDMVVDDRPFVKFSAKPSVDTGVEFTPKSACGALIIAYKDFDREKRWDVTLDFGDFDTAKLEIVGGGDQITADSSTGRAVGSDTVENSARVVAGGDDPFLTTDVGRSITGTGIEASSYIVEVSDLTRVVTDGVTVNSDATVTSATAAFTSADLGKHISGTNIPAGATIITINSGTSVEVSAVATGAGTGLTLTIGNTVAVINNAATADGSAVSLTLGALAARPIGYQYPALLSVPNPYGVSVEIWQKAIVRGTGYQGTTPYPSLGDDDPYLPASAWVRWGIFRVLNLHHADIAIEDKESMAAFTGFAIENPNFGTGPVGDWTQTAVAGGVPVPTTRWCNAMADFQLPAPLQPGYQTTTG